MREFKTNVGISKKLSKFNILDSFLNRFKPFTCSLTEFVSNSNNFALITNQICIPLYSYPNSNSYPNSMKQKMFITGGNAPKNSLYS